MTLSIVVFFISGLILSNLSITISLNVSFPFKSIILNVYVPFVFTLYSIPTVVFPLQLISSPFGLRIFFRPFGFETLIFINIVPSFI